METPQFRWVFHLCFVENIFPSREKRSYVRFTNVARQRNNALGLFTVSLLMMVRAAIVNNLHISVLFAVPLKLLLLVIKTS
jgi:hypothetical protein